MESAKVAEAFNTHLHLMPRSITLGAIPPHPLHAINDR
jgi:hypothetical protein